MRNIILFFFVVLCLSSSAKTGIIYKYWIEFTDKTDNGFSSDNPLEFLSPRALQRRERYKIPVIENDLPVTGKYYDSIASLNVNILYTSRWFNAVVAETTDSLLIEKLSSVDFVKRVELLYKGLLNPPPSCKSSIQEFDDYSDLNYGKAQHQIEIHQGHHLHRKGYQGQDKVIAILDAGFYGADSLQVFDSLWINEQILGYKDFVDPAGNIFAESAHGMKVLSILGGNLPGELIGTAPKAKYWLIRSEDTQSEYRIEEANWIAAAEFADSVGADVINSSLGYSTFTDSLQNYFYKDMDGETTLVTRGADMAASKGMLVVVSAGNSGSNDWTYITAPADGKRVITVGAVDSIGQYAPFSSKGPTFDGRIKPNVVAIGMGTYLQNQDSTIGTGSGTSFAAPIITGLVTCLWQMFPQQTNDEIIQAIESSAHRYPYPDYLVGYGIPNFGVAVDLITGKITLYPLNICIAHLIKDLTGPFGNILKFDH